MSTFSCHLFPVSGQDCLAVITNFKHRVFDISSVHCACVGMLDLNGTQLQVRAKQAPWDMRRNLLWAEEWGRGSLFPPTMNPRAHRETYRRDSCRVLGALPSPHPWGKSPFFPSPALPHTSSSKCLCFLCLHWGKGDTNNTWLIQLLGGRSEAHVLSTSESFWRLVGIY